MFTLVVANEYGQQLELTNNQAYDITSIDGLDPPDSVINTTRNTYMDGTVYNSAYIDSRKITITISINGPAEKNRINLYRYFKTKFPVRIFYRNDTRNVYIDGYVQSMPIGFFEKKQVAQIVIFCPEPLFNGADTEMIEFSTVTPQFSFPFEIPEKGVEFSTLEVGTEKNIINRGDVETGIIIHLRAINKVVNPVVYNTETREYFGLDTTMNKAEEIVINTKTKEKAVELHTVDGEKINLLGVMRDGSTWLRLKPGDNLYTTTAKENPQNLEAYCMIQSQFEGV